MIAQVLQKLKRFPGRTTKNADGKPLYWRFGTVIHASPRMIYADTGPSSVHQRYISLQGESYVYVCQSCSQSITQKMYDDAQQLPDRAEERCPNCKAQKSLRYVRIGEKMRFHFRVDIHADDGRALKGAPLFDAQGNPVALSGGAGWFGEVLVGE